MTRILLSIPQTTEVLGVGRATVYELIRGGKIAPVKIGRRTLIAQTELDRFVATLTAEAAGTVVGAA